MTTLTLSAQRIFKAGLWFLIFTWVRREMTGRREMAKEGGGPEGAAHILVLQEVSLRVVCGLREGLVSSQPSPLLTLSPPGRC